MELVLVTIVLTLLVSGFLFHVKKDMFHIKDVADRWTVIVRSDSLDAWVRTDKWDVALDMAESFWEATDPSSIVEIRDGRGPVWLNGQLLQ